MMKRRVFFVIAGGVAAWPLTAGAQQSRSVRTVAVIMGFAESDPVRQSYPATFRQRLDDFGWHEGRNVQFKYWYTGESSDRTHAAATEAVATKPDVILASTNPVISALQQVTQSIPIVFTWVSDSVGSRYVASLSKPGGNITGFHNYEPALGAKWIGILREIAPSARRVAFVLVPEISANVAFMRAAEASAAPQGMTVSAAGVRSAADVWRVLTVARDPNGGLIVTPSPLTATRRDVIIEVANRLRLPAMYSFGFYVASGGLISYGIDQTELVREAASSRRRVSPATISGGPSQFVGDGMMAIFGVHAGEREACSQALGAAQLIHSRLADMNRTMADELPEPIVIGVGLHAGSVILGELGYKDRFVLTAIGDSVHVAARLQELTKDYGCQLIVSEIVATTAGVEMSGFPLREVTVRGRAEPLAVRIVSAMNELVA